MGPGLRRGDNFTRSIQRNTARITAHVGGRIERLAVDRAVVVLAREGWIAKLRRKGVVGELAIAGQDFDAGIEPGTLGDIDPGVRPLLIGHVRTAGPVIGPAAVVVLALGLGLRAGRGQCEADDGGCRKQHRKLFRNREIPGHRVLTGGTRRFRRHFSGRSRMATRSNRPHCRTIMRQHDKSCLKTSTLAAGPITARRAERGSPLTSPSPPYWWWDR